MTRTSISVTVALFIAVVAAVGGLYFESAARTQTQAPAAASRVTITTPWPAMAHEDSHLPTTANIARGHEDSHLPPPVVPSPAHEDSHLP